MSKPAEALGGIRKLLQDVIAPEVQGIKASLAALHEGQQLIRDEMKAQEARSREEMKAFEGRFSEQMKAQEGRFSEQLQAQEGRFSEQMKAQETRLTRVIESTAKETILTIQLAESERRNSELARRLEESTNSSTPARN